MVGNVWREFFLPRVSWLIVSVFDVSVCKSQATWLFRRNVQKYEDRWCRRFRSVIFPVGRKSQYRELLYSYGFFISVYTEYIKRYRGGRTVVSEEIFSFVDFFFSIYKSGTFCGKCYCLSVTIFSLLWHNYRVVQFFNLVFLLFLVPLIKLRDIYQIGHLY